MKKIAFSLLFIFVTSLSMSTKSHAFSFSDFFGSKTEVKDENKEQGACVYFSLITYTCKENVTKEWCDKKNNSEWGKSMNCEAETIDG